MASTSQGRRLTEQHRKALLAQRARALREVVTAWLLLDPERLDQTAQPWLSAMLELIARHHRSAAAKGQDYYQAFRAAETGLLVPPRFGALDDPDARRLVASLTVTGPAQIKRLTAAGLTPEQAARKALRHVAGAASRHVLNGDREALRRAMYSDEAALGWARVTDGEPCAFCAMLASRGPVYKRETGSFRSHDMCGCTAEPVFSRRQPWPGRGEEFEQLWMESTAGHSGRGALNAFRRAYEGK